MDTKNVGTRAQDTTGYVVDSGKPLSRSLLWEIQRRYFEGQGIDAWRKNIVPHYLTSNPFIAQAYARVVLGYLRDCLPTLDPGQPVYIIELGAGSGRFAFHFQRKFQALLAQSPFPGLRFCYVLTDLAEANIEFCRQHPSLQAWVAAGCLDFARFDAAHFDAERGHEIRLLHSGQALAAGALKNPPVLIANYFFDSLPQDAFYFEDGRMMECLVRLTSSQPEPDPSDPSVLGRLSILFERSACRADYYGSGEFDSILDEYRRSLEATYLLFPGDGIRCLRGLAPLAGGRLMLLTGDYGFSRLPPREGQRPPEVHIHGSFSLDVNYHAIGRWVENQGGQVFTTEQRAAHLAVCAFVLGQPPAGCVETRLAFAEAIERGGPDEFFLLKRGVEKHYDGFDLEEMLAWLRISGWDGRLFLDCYPAMLEKAPAAPPRVQAAVPGVLEHIWENYYHLGEERDLPFCAGVLLFKLDRIAEALAFFERSLEWYGPSPAALYNAAMCHARQQQFGRAQARLKEALALDPQFAPAVSLAKQLQKYRPLR